MDTSPKRKKDMKKLLINFCLILIIPTNLCQAQELLTLDKAIEIALKNNYQVILSRNNSQINTNNNTFGNAGFLPQINLNASGFYASNNTQQRYANGQEVNQTSVSSNNLNAGAAFTWTLFDGLKMFATSGKLKTLATAGEFIARSEIENVVLSLILSYAEVVKIKQLIHSSEEQLSIYEEREKISQTKFDIGSGSKSELLQTKVDKNALLSITLIKKYELEAAKANLNLFLGRTAEFDFDISDSMPVLNSYKKEDLDKSVFLKNAELLIAETAIQVNSYSIKEYESFRLPKIGINANYNFLQTENKAGFSLYNKTYGINAGFNISWNIFNGFNNNLQIKNARLMQNISKDQYNFVKTGISVSLSNAWKKFENAKKIQDLEEVNILLAQENADIALERFKLGASGILELKDAQNSLELASVRVVNARYETKIAEATLMKINGDLVK